MWTSLKSMIAGDLAGQLTSYHFEFGVPLPRLLCIIILIAIASGAGLYVQSKLSKVSRSARATLALLRAAAVLLVFFLLLDPCIVARRIRPEERYLVMLFDDSRSMMIQGADGNSRGLRLKDSYSRAQKGLEEELLKRNRIVKYGFGGGIRPVKTVADLDFAKKDSDLTGSIRQALAELKGIDVTGIVLFSDGIQRKSNASEENPAPPQKGFTGGIPVYAVGVDSEAPWRDLEVGKLSINRTQFDKSPVVANILLHSTGLAGKEGNLEIRENGRPIKSAHFAIGEDQQDQEIRMEFIPATKDWVEYTVTAHLAGSDGPAGSQDAAVDRVEQNNSRRFLMDNRPKEYRVLYFSGRPNWENKFVRRALEEDDQIKLTSLIRISRADEKFVFRGKKSASVSNPLFEGFGGDRGEEIRWDEAVFLRMGVQGSELEKGYPTAPEDLFPFQLMIWGEIEHNFFSNEQLELTRDYVRKRGGSLLFMGGPHSFTEGHFDGTLIEGMMPALLRPSSKQLPPDAFDLTKSFGVKPTVDGLLSGTWSLDPSPDEDKRLWGTMPSLSGLNQFPMLRPGATVMARAVSQDQKAEGAPLFVSERFGEGRTAMLATATTWQWQLELDHDDTRHERLWRQIVRGLVEGVPDAAYLREKRDSYQVGHEAGLDFVLSDKAYD
ncbi:hypothetical protein HYR69_04365, partial [Candidatus Sumerlaeota bacterium]|nr:hypothetical protein [Candidatus Sumerlaeota bacterium]